MADYDSPWKEMLDNYFPDFMAFFFPAIHGTSATASPLTTSRARSHKEL